MLGVIVNVVAVLMGGSIGLLLKKGLPRRLSDALMKAIGLSTLYIGVTGMTQGGNTMVLILSMIVGVLIGEGADLDLRINRMAQGLEQRFQKEDGEGPSIASGFVAGSLLFCVGAMTIVGSLQAGLSGDNQMLFTKSMMDFISSMVFGSTLGVGVLFSAAFVLVFQGGIVLLSSVIAPYLGDYVVVQISCVGSLLILALGLNVIGLSKFKVMNYMPAVFVPIVLCLLPFFS